MLSKTSSVITAVAGVSMGVLLNLPSAASLAMMSFLAALAVENISIKVLKDT